jgi:hypothetical protein
MDLEEDKELDDLVKRIHDDYRASTEDLRDWDEEAREATRIRHGHQWSEEDKLKLDALERPALTFNRTGPFVDAVLGMEISNRKEARYIKRVPGKPVPHDLLGGAAEWVRDETDAEDEESHAFTDMLTTGLGWIDTTINYTEDPDGMGDITRRDPFRIRYDTRATKRNLTDRRWDLYLDDMSMDEIQQQWPEADLDGQNLKGPWDKDMESPQSSMSIDKSGIDEYLTDETGSGKRDDRKTIWVARYQYIKYKAIMRVATQEGIEEYDPKEWEILKEQYLAMGTPHKAIRQKRKVVQQAYVVGGHLLEDGPAPCEREFSMSAVTGKYDEVKGVFYGFIRPMKDPQTWANVFLSTLLDIMMSIGKGGLVAEEDATDDPKKLEETWANPTAVSWLNPGGLNKVKEKPVGAYPNGIDRLLQFAIQSFPDVTGLNLEILGLAGKDQAGIVETTRKQSALNNIAWAFDAMRRYRKQQARILAHLITNYLNDGRLVRVTTSEGQEYQPLQFDADGLKYDIIIDEAPTSPSMKDRVFQIMTELLPSLQSMGVPIPPSLLRYTPFPEKLIEEWLQYIQDAQAKPDPNQERLMKGMADEREAKAMEVAASAEKKQAEAEQTDIENKILQSTGIMP